MTKLDRLKKLLGIAGSEQDEVLSVYLDFAKDEILSWLYSGKKPAGVTDVPTQYEATQIMACVAGLSMRGAEGQISHSENNISRSWKYEDMVSYVRQHVFPYVEVV